MTRLRNLFRKWLSLYSNFRFAQTLVPISKYNTESIHIPLEDDDSSTPNIPFHFTFPFYQLYYPKYQFNLATVMCKNLTRDLPQEGLSKTARLEVSPINNARIMTLDPENLKGYKGYVNNKSKTNASRGGEEKINVIGNKCDYCGQISTTMQCPCKNARILW
ncbi:unnamed protein product [Rhizophagus irregularis]|nr:unnamed protein product [Rhizophagus irregularis]